MEEDTQTQNWIDMMFSRLTTKILFFWSKNRSQYGTLKSWIISAMTSPVFRQKMKICGIQLSPSYKDFFIVPWASLPWLIWTESLLHHNWKNNNSHLSHYWNRNYKLEKLIELGWFFSHLSIMHLMKCMQTKIFVSKK